MRGIIRMDRAEKFKLLKLLTLFIFLGVVFIEFRPSAWIWFILSGCAVAWFLIELYFEKPSSQRIRKAITLGLFLMVYDFLFENSGTVFDLWRSSDSIFFVWTVPVEVMVLCLFGGAAWYLYIPREFNRTYSVLDIALISTFGALGEYILIQNGLMHYYLWWTSLHALASYTFTWIILHFVRYSIIR